MRALGTPPDLRVLYRSNQLEAAAAAFAAHVERTASGVLDDLAAELRRAPPTALLCLEADPEGCHRRVVAERLQARDPTLEVVDL